MTTGLKNSFHPSLVQYGFLKHPCLPLSSLSSDIIYKGQILFKGRNIKSLYCLILSIFSFWLFRTTISSLASHLSWPIMPLSQMGPWLPSTMNSSGHLKWYPTGLSCFFMTQVYAFLSDFVHSSRGVWKLYPSHPKVVHGSAFNRKISFI